jgi:hypothetical protein
VGYVIPREEHLAQILSAPYFFGNIALPPQNPSLGGTGIRIPRPHRRKKMLPADGPHPIHEEYRDIFIKSL